MTLTVRSPSTIVDLANLSNTMDPVSWAVVREMWRVGDSFTLLWDGKAIAIANLYPMDDGGYEATFNFTPEATKHMLAIVRATRLTLIERAYPAIVTLCVTDAGARLARAVGFFHAKASPNGEVYAYGGPIVRRRGPQAGSAKTAAAVAG